MGWSIESVQRLMRERGLAWTPQRRAIVRHLLEHGGHWSASRLLAELTAELPKASRATVYSTLALLRELGVVAALPGPGGELRFDANPEAHHHLHCRRCDRLEDVPEAWIPVQLAPEAGASFQVERFNVVAEGLCAECLSLSSS